MADFRTLKDLNVDSVFNYKGAYKRLKATLGKQMTPDDCESVISDTLVDCWLTWDRAKYTPDQFRQYARQKLDGRVGWAAHRSSFETVWSARENNGESETPVDENLGRTTLGPVVSERLSDTFEDKMCAFVHLLLFEDVRSDRQRAQARDCYQMFLLRYRDKLEWSEIAKITGFASKQAAQRRYKLIFNSVEDKIRCSTDRVYEYFGVVLGDKVLEAVGV